MRIFVNYCKTSDRSRVPHKQRLWGRGNLYW